MSLEQKGLIVRNLLTGLMLVCPAVTENTGWEAGRLLTESTIGCSKMQEKRRQKNTKRQARTVQQYDVSEGTRLPYCFGP